MSFTSDNPQFAQMLGNILSSVSQDAEDLKNSVQGTISESILASACKAGAGKVELFTTVYVFEKPVVRFVVKTDNSTVMSNASLVEACREYFYQRSLKNI